MDDPHRSAQWARDNPDAVTRSKCLTWLTSQCNGITCPCFPNLPAPQPKDED